MRPDGMGRGWVKYGRVLVRCYGIEGCRRARGAVSCCSSLPPTSPEVSMSWSLDTEGRLRIPVWRTALRRRSR